MQTTSALLLVQWKMGNGELGNGKKGTVKSYYIRERLSYQQYCADNMKKISNINQGDLLAFKANDEKYKALLCTSAYNEESPHYFTFAALNYDDFEKPTVANILHCDFWGIGNRKDSHIKYADIELNRMWTCHPEIKPYVLGSYGIVVRKKDFMQFGEIFEVIGNLKIVDNLDKNGNGGMNASDLNFIKDFFSGKINSVLPDRGQKLFKLEAIITD